MGLTTELMFLATGARSEPVLSSHLKFGDSLP
jgi:hypothetical protein